MIFDAIVLAGGRSSRLGGVSKAELVVNGRSLLSRTIDATDGARQVVIVGVPTIIPTGVLVTREEPVFSGPAAAISAGLDVLHGSPASVNPADFVLVLACDVPNSAAAVAALLAWVTDGHDGGGVEGSGADGSGPDGSGPDGSGVDGLGADDLGADGVIAIDEGARRQPLLGLYRTGPLVEAVRGRQADIHNLSVRALLSPLDLTEISVPSGSTDDIDTWADAESYGIVPPDLPVQAAATRGQSMNDRDRDTTRDDDATLRALKQWSDRLSAALGFEQVAVDIEAVLALAGTAAHAVMRPAAPLTTYLVGYAAGVAAGAAAASHTLAVESARLNTAIPAAPTPTDAASAAPAFNNAAFNAPTPNDAAFNDAAAIATALANSNTP